MVHGMLILIKFLTFTSLYRAKKINGWNQKDGNQLMDIVAKKDENQLLEEKDGNPLMNEKNGNPLMDEKNGNPLMDEKNGNPLMDEKDGNLLLDVMDEKDGTCSSPVLAVNLFT